MVLVIHLDNTTAVPLKSLTGTGTGAEATITVTDEVITGVNITSVGSGYQLVKY